jgi:hypothetical protein
MRALTTSGLHNAHSFWRAILKGGAIAGLLDIIFAISFAASNGMSAQKLLQIVASGALGQKALLGGWGIATLGLTLHFFMSFLYAAAYCCAARYFAVLTRKPLIFGALFGIAVFFFMRLVVLPLSAFPFPVSFKPYAAGMDLLSHMFLFGVPIALCARRVAR